MTTRETEVEKKDPDDVLSVGSEDSDCSEGSSDEDAQTVCRTVCVLRRVESEDSDSSEGFSSDEDNNSWKNMQAAQLADVLYGVDNVKPLKENSDGMAEATQLGYSSKLVSKWYKHQCSRNSFPQRWAEFDNVDDELVHMVSQNSTIPILHRYKYENKHWITESFQIQDVTMREVLRVTLANYQDLDLDVIQWTFKPPFMPIVHRWENLKSQYADLETGSIKNAAAALLAFLAPIIAPSILSLAEPRRSGRISFDNLWQILPPGCIVKTKLYGVETLCKVESYKKQPKDNKNRPSWVISMNYVDFNGERSGWATTKLTIWKYEGYKKVTGLPCFPISFSADEASIKTAMMERGRKWAGLRGFHLQTANGTRILLEKDKPKQVPVSGRVCVDPYAYYRSHNIVKPTLRPLIAAPEDEQDMEAVDDSESLGAEGFKTSFSVAKVEVSAKATERVQEHYPLSEEELLMTTPWVKGFDLNSKEFCELNISELEDVKWNDDAFEKLVLPGGEKELAWTFVENKSQSNPDFDDFVTDKGRGLIIMMFGPPGVGKTFTAEAVAERSRVPLYYMSAGDLGTDPQDVEEALERALGVCRMWNAMLLLDEADVFLGQRTQQSLERNELVSIFLTKLEYYQGIVFLTTNRVACIDHAFQSRVDLFLPYHDLTSDSRRQVWQNFIDHASRDKFELNADSLDRLSELKLNGREIKNLIKSAQLLSMKNSGKIPVDHLLLLAHKRVLALKHLEGN